MAGNRRTFAERYMLYTLEVEGVSYNDLNIRMREAGFGFVPRSTFDMNMRNEARLFKARPELLVKFSESPVPYGNWPDSWRQLRDSQ